MCLSILPLSFINISTNTYMSSSSMRSIINPPSIIYITIFEDCSTFAFPYILSYNPFTVVNCSIFVSFRLSFLNLALSIWILFTSFVFKFTPKFNYCLNIWMNFLGLRLFFTPHKWTWTVVITIIWFVGSWWLFIVFWTFIFLIFFFRNSGQYTSPRIRAWCIAIIGCKCCCLSIVKIFLIFFITRCSCLCSKISSFWFLPFLE